MTVKSFDIASELNTSFTPLSCASGNFATSTENANARAGPISSAPSRYGLAHVDDGLGDLLRRRCRGELGELAGLLGGSGLEHFSDQSRRNALAVHAPQEVDAGFFDPIVSCRRLAHLFEIGADRVDARLDLIERAYLGGSGDAKPLDRPRDDVLQLEIVAAVRKHVLDEVLGRGFVLPGQLGGNLVDERHRLGLVLAVV